MFKTLIKQYKIYYLFFSLLITTTYTYSSSSFRTKELFYGTAKQFSRLVGIPQTPRYIIEKFQAHSPALGIFKESALSYDQTTPSHSFKHLMSPPKDQKNSNSCVSFSTIAALEKFYPGIRLSEGQIAKMANIESDGYCTYDGLMNLGVGMEYAHTHGIIEEKYWPFNDSDVCSKDFPSNYDKLPKHSFRWVYNLLTRDNSDVIPVMEEHYNNKKIPPLSRQAIDDPDLTSIRFTLLRNIPVVIEVPIASEENEMKSGWESGKNGISLPSTNSIRSWLNDGDNMPYHAITLVGYNDKLGFFEFKNHWRDKSTNSWWGNGGYSTIPYQYIKYYGRYSLYGVIPGIAIK